jgi:hypothetical protein
VSIKANGQKLIFKIKSFLGEEHITLEKYTKIILSFMEERDMEDN